MNVLVHICPHFSITMSYKVITAVASMRAEPSHRSEMISQLLFGETGVAMEQHKDFVKIQSTYDGYEGWVQKKQLVHLPDGVPPFVQKLSRHIQDRVLVNEQPVILSPGSLCAVPDSSDSLQLGPYNLQFLLHENPVPEFASKSLEILHYARLFLGTPYLWGGRSRYGIDCSGLTQVVYKLAGILLPRDSGPQAQGGEVVDFLEGVQPGDLAFFDNEEGKIIHVGLMLNSSKILHASANCRIDPIDNEGIVHLQEKDRTHRLRVIKRFF